MNNHIISKHHIDVDCHEVVVFFVLHNVKLIGPNSDHNEIEEYIPETVPNHYPSQNSEEFKICWPFDCKEPGMKTEEFQEQSIVYQPKIASSPSLVPINVDVQVEANG